MGDLHFYLSKDFFFFWISRLFHRFLWSSIYYLSYRYLCSEKVSMILYFLFVCFPRIFQKQLSGTTHLQNARLQNTASSKGWDAKWSLNVQSKRWGFSSFVGPDHQGIIIPGMTSLRSFKAVILVLFLEMTWFSVALAFSKIRVMLCRKGCQAKLFSGWESTCLPTCKPVL